MAPLFAGGSDGRSGRRRWTDRIVGVLVGLLLGLGILVYFVFGHSEGTIDAPKLSGGAGKSAAPSPSRPGNSSSTEGSGATEGSSGTAEPPAKPTPNKQTRPIPVVKVVGGAPPTGAGPKQLTFRQGERVRFEIETDEPFSFEIRGLGIKETIERSSIVSFKATRAGQFPVIASATLIGVADLLIKKR